MRYSIQLLNIRCANGEDKCFGYRVYDGSECIAESLHPHCSPATAINAAVSEEKSVILNCNNISCVYDKVYYYDIDGNPVNKVQTQNVLTRISTPDINKGTTSDINKLKRRI